MAKAVFLDRDGTLNTDPGYISDPAQFELISGVADAIRTLEGLGFLRFVVSNQSGVNRGLITMAQLESVQQKMAVELAKHGASITESALCVHRPEERCPCRKPSPHLVRDLANRHQLDLRQSYFVGDRESDLDCGTAAGCRASILVLTGEGVETLQKMVDRGHPPLYVAPDLRAAVDIIAKIESTGSGGGQTQGRSESR